VALCVVQYNLQNDALLMHLFYKLEVVCNDIYAAEWAIHTFKNHFIAGLSSANDPAPPCASGTD
jgi:hypothetical protein